jgi:hypothetical protein
MQSWCQMWILTKVFNQILWKRCFSWQKASSRGYGSSNLYREIGQILCFVYFFGWVACQWPSAVSLPPRWCHFCSASLPHEWCHFLLTSVTINLFLYKHWTPTPLVPLLFRMFLDVVHNLFYHHSFGRGALSRYLQVFMFVLAVKAHPP